MRLYLDGIGVWGAGLADWPQARSVLNGELRYVASSQPLPAPAVLPAAERRRSPATARIAVQVAAEACAMAGVDPAQVPSVFASSHGDTQITDYMCRELALDAPLSPTRFHNSVHNAANGYWTIAVNCMHSSTALSGGERSFDYGLLEAAAQALAGLRAVLLVAYDLAAPAPLVTVCPILVNFGVGLVLSPVASARSLARLELSQASDSKDPPLLPEGLDALMSGNPAARALPLLFSVAVGQAGGFGFPPVRWEIAPC